MVDKPVVFRTAQHCSLQTAPGLPQSL